MGSDGEEDIIVRDDSRAFCDIGRLNAFSDGVMVFSITILVLDIRLPDRRELEPRPGSSHQPFPVDQKTPCRKESVPCLKAPHWRSDKETEMQWHEHIGRRLKLRNLHILLAVVQSRSMAKRACDFPARRVEGDR